MSNNRELRFNMLDALEIVLSRKVPILAFAFFVAALTAVYTLVVSPKYLAQTVLLPPSGESSSFSRILQNMPLGKLAGVSNILQGTPNDQSSVYMAILGSRSLRIDLIEEFDLISVYKFDKTKRYYIEDVLKLVNKNIAVGIDDETGSILIEATDKDPQRAAAMANYMAHQLDEIYKRTMTEKNRNYRVFLGEKVELVKADLIRAEEAMVGFQKENNMLDIESQAKATIEMGVGLEARFMKSQATLEVARKAFSEDHPKVRELRLELDQLEKQRSQMSKGRGSEILIPYQSSPEIGLKYLRLLREFEIQQAIFELMIQQYEEAKFEESKNTPTVQILDQAVPPQKRIFPKRRSMVQMAFAASLVAGVLFTLVLSRIGAFKRNHPDEYARYAGVARLLWFRRKPR